MKVSFLLLLPLALASCDPKKAREAGKEYGRQTEPAATQLGESADAVAHFIVGSMEGASQSAKERRARQTGQPEETFEQRAARYRRQAEQEMRDKIRARDKGFPGHAKDSGFPGFAN